MSDVIVKVAIIGAGPAGYTAATYAARAQLEPVLFEGLQPGGQLTTTTDIENYPGFPEGIDGNQLMMQMRSQAERFGTKVIPAAITDIDVSARPFTLTIDGDQQIKAEAVIVATGATARYLGTAGEEEFKGRGVSACATCDGAFFRDVEVAVVGGGDTAAEEALFLTRFASKVYLIHRRDELRASKIMVKRVLEHEKIEVLWDTVIEEYKGEQLLNTLSLKNVKTGEIYDKPIDGVFVAIGHKPNTDIFKGKLDMDELGYLVTQPNRTATNVEGVYACGDVQDHYYRQAITAAGTGCAAAIEAERWLAEQDK